MDEFTALFSRKDMTFEEAVAYFKERVPVTASRFYQIAAEYRALAFTVSGYTKAQVLKKFYDELLAALEEGKPKQATGYSYIGRYHCASGYKSTTGAAQQVNITRSQARSGIHNLGANFWQMDFAQFWYVNMLFLVEFADWNGERIGRGCSTNGSKMNNGQTDAMGYHTGTTAASRDSYGFTQYRNIEGWWDNVYDWMDGCYYNNNGLNVISNPNNFSDSANGTLVGMPSSGYPSDFTIPTASGLEWALFPSAANGSQTTYVPDYWVFGGSNPCLCHGGYYFQYRDHGPFCVLYSSTSDSDGSVGCRLQERPPKAA